MSEFISTFTTGFGDIIESAARRCLVKKISVIKIHDGLAHYRYDGNAFDLLNIPCFNNTFFVIKSYRGANLSFDHMVKTGFKGDLKFPIKTGRFRVRFSRLNRFESVDRKLMNLSEIGIKTASRLRREPLRPDTEFWYIIRSENIGFFAQLLKKRDATEKNLKKGELRPELAYLLCFFAGIENNDVLCDPFAGSGSIPGQAEKHFSFEHFVVSDDGKPQINALKKLFADNGKISVFHAKVTNLKTIVANPVDKIITDPPWGVYEKIDDIVPFYKEMFASFRKALKGDGLMVVLCARKSEIEEAAKESGVEIIDVIHTLVNGKKAGAYKMRFI